MPGALVPASGSHRGMSPPTGRPPARRRGSETGVGRAEDRGTARCEQSGDRDHHELPEVRKRAPRRIQVLQRLRRHARCRARECGSIPRPARLHTEAPRRQDPAIEVRPRRRAQAGHGPVRGREGLDGARRAARSRSVAPHPRTLLRDPHRGRASLRRYGEPVHRRRHHGALRRAAGGARGVGRHLPLRAHGAAGRGLLPAPGSRSHPGRGSRRAGGALRCRRRRRVPHTPRSRAGARVLDLRRARSRHDSGAPTTESRMATRPT